MQNNSEGNSLYLDCHAGHTGVKICQSWLKYIRKMGVFYCVYVPPSCSSFAKSHGGAFWREGVAEFPLSVYGRDSCEKQSWHPRDISASGSMECAGPDDQGPNERQLTCPFSLFLNAQRCQVKSTEWRMIKKIVKNPPSSRTKKGILGLSFAGYPANWGIWAPFTLSLPFLGFLAPSAVFSIPFCSTGVAIYKIFLSGICSLKLGIC